MHVPRLANDRFGSNSDALRTAPTAVSAEQETSSPINLNSAPGPESDVVAPH